MSYDKEKLDEILNKAHQDIENARRNDGITQGKPSLDLNPPGVPSPQKKQFATEKEIDNKVADIKADAMKQADDLFEGLSPEERKEARDSVRNNLYPEDPKPGIGESKKDWNQSQEQMNALSSKYARDKQNLHEPDPSKSPDKPTPDIPPEGKNEEQKTDIGPDKKQEQQPTRYEQSLSSFKNNQEEVTQDKDPRRNFTKNGKDISDAEAKKEEEDKDDKNQEIEKEQPDTKDQPVMEDRQPEIEGNEDVGQQRNGERYLSSLSSEKEGQEMDAPEMSKEQESKDSVSMDDKE